MSRIHENLHALGVYNFHTLHIHKYTAKSTKNFRPNEIKTFFTQTGNKANGQNDCILKKCSNDFFFDLHETNLKKKEKQQQ